MGRRRKGRQAAMASPSFMPLALKYLVRNYAMVWCLINFTNFNKIIQDNEHCSLSRLIEQALDMASPYMPLALKYLVHTGSIGIGS